MIDPNKYYVVQGWMVSELGLKGNALHVYAIIYGFSQDGVSEYAGSARYLSNWLGCSLRTIMTVLADLTERGLLIKTTAVSNGQTFCNYKASKAIRPADPPAPKPTKADKAAGKRKHGEYDNVLLTDEELTKLMAEYPNDWSERIDRLSEYIKSTGKRYSSHYATIRAWARKDQERTAAAGKGGPNGIRIDPTKNDLAEYFQ